MLCACSVFLNGPSARLAADPVRRGLPMLSQCSLHRCMDIPLLVSELIGIQVQVSAAVCHIGIAARPPHPPCARVISSCIIMDEGIQPPLPCSGHKAAEVWGCLCSAGWACAMSARAKEVGFSFSVCLSNAASQTECRSFYGHIDHLCGGHKGYGMQ